MEKAKIDKYFQVKTGFISKNIDSVLKKFTGVWNVEQFAEKMSLKAKQLPSLGCCL